MNEAAALQLFAHLEGGGGEAQCGSPNRSGSCHVRHGVGDISGPGVRRYGYLRPKPDGLGQVYCRPTELWAATSPIQFSSGYADPGDSGSLLGVGESFGTEEGVP